MRAPGHVSPFRSSARQGNAGQGGGSGVDISSIDFWSRPFDERDERFALLRARQALTWHPPLETPGLPPQHRQAGFWAAATVEHITAVSRDPSRFSSALGQVAVRPAPFRIARNMLVSDPPDHGVLRGPLAGTFSPAGLRRIAPRIERAVRQTVLRGTLHREFDLVTTIAGVVPARVLAILLGVPDGEIPRFVVAVEAFAGAGVPAGLADEPLQAWFERQAAWLTGFVAELARFRRTHPEDDVISVLVQQGWSTEDPDRPLVSTALMLIVAGHDTMKQLITLAVLALLRNPAERQWLLDDVDGRFDQAFDELVRHASPVLSFARTATTDVRLGGADIAAGDKVALFYCSGNRDERHFTDPAALRLSRPRGHHVAFGGGGVHFCLGAALARMQLRAVLPTLFSRAPGLTADEPVYAFDDAVHRVERLPVRRA